MTNSQTNTKAFILYTLGTVVNILSSYAILILLTDRLPKAVYAKFGFYNTVFALLLIFINFGCKEAIYKAASRSDTRDTQGIFKWFACWQVFLLSLCFLCAAFYPEFTLIFVCYLCTQWLLTINAVNRGNGHFLQDACGLPIQRALWFVALCVLATSTQNLDIGQIFACSLLATVIALIFVSRKLPPVNITTKVIKPPSILYKFLFIEFSTVAYTRLDMLFLNHFKVEQHIIADYYFSLQLFEAAILLLAPISYFFFNRYAQSQKKKYSMPSDGPSITLYSLSLLGLVFLGQLMWFLGGEYLLTLIFPQYVSAYNKVSIFLWILYPVVLNFILSSYAILNNREKTYMIICFFALLVTLTLSSVLVPIYGEVGVIYSRFLTEITILFLLLHVTRRLYSSKHSDSMQ